MWNEVSRRYVDDEPTLFFPDKWRKRADNVKQGSSDEEIKNIWWIKEDSWYSVTTGVKEGCMFLLDRYKKMIAEGVAPEQARMILPQNMMTSWYWTGSLMFFYRVWKQRSDAHAQKETQEVAKQISDICETLFPVSWKALVESK